MSATYPLGRIRQHPSYPHSGPFARRYHPLDRSRSDPGQERGLLCQGIELVSVQYTATREQADDPVGSCLDDGLYVLIFEFGSGKEQRAVATLIICVYPVDL